MERKKAMCEWLVALATHHPKIRGLTFFFFFLKEKKEITWVQKGKKKNFKQNTYKTPHFKGSGVACQLYEKLK